jgi:AcrR family transcriptional regulator
MKTSMRRYGPSQFGRCQPRCQDDTIRLVNASRRRRSSHRAILAATRELIQERGYGSLTIEGVAARAGVGKQTIYRWWPSKGAVAIEALLDEIHVAIEFPDTGHFDRDLGSLLASVAELLAAPETGPPLTALLADTQHDYALRDIWQEQVFRPIRGRYLERVAAAREAGQVPADVADDEILDCAFGPLWFRALTRPEAMNEAFGQTVARVIFDGLSARPVPQHA